MWVSEFKAWHKDSVILELSKGVDAWLAGYYLNAFEENGESYTARAVAFFGREKELLQNAFEKDPRACILGREGNQLFYSIKRNDSFHSTVMDKSVFLAKPVIIKDGFEYLTVASWDKERIKSFFKRINALRPNAKADILTMKERRLDLFLPGALSELTDLQRNALESAVERGYYSFPRKNSLEEISKAVKMPRTTFQNHLRKAEEKIMPAVIDQSKI